MENLTKVLNYKLDKLLSIEESNQMWTYLSSDTTKQGSQKILKLVNVEKLVTEEIEADL